MLLKLGSYIQNKLRNAKSELSRNSASLQATFDKISQNVFSLDTQQAPHQECYDLWNQVRWNGNVEKWYLCKHIRLSNIIFHKHCRSFEHTVWPLLLKENYSQHHLTFLNRNRRKLKRIFGSLVLTSDQFSDNFTRGSNNAGPDNAFVLFLCCSEINFIQILGC